MTEEEREEHWMRGNRAAWLSMLQTCLRELGGYEDPEVQKVAWIKEREAAIQQLRLLCEEFGDNEWQPNLFLADIIEKHLGKHLYYNQE